MAMMINLDCQLDTIKNHYGNTAPGVSFMPFPDILKWEDLPRMGGYHPLGSDME